ncbi:MAG: PH domain-containing protein [Phycisphaeraceae bacterium]
MSTADTAASPPKARERVLREATFRPEAPIYASVLASIGPAIVGILCFVTIFLIPVGILLGAGVAGIFWYYKRYYASLRVSATSRDLKVHRGILNREEKSIPLEKITDLAIFQGPIMRYFGLQGIRVETAGQSGGLGALVSVVGIEGTEGFRDTVLDQRDRIADRDETSATPSDVASPGQLANQQVLLDIRDTLHRIETRLTRDD